MTEEEAIANLAKARAARIYSDELLNRVRNAQIIGSRNPAELERMVNELPLPELRKLFIELRTNPALANDPSFNGLSGLLKQQIMMLESR